MSTLPARHSAEAVSSRQQVPERTVDKRGVFGLPARPRPVAPGRGDRAKLGVGHVGDLVFAVFGREVGIGLSGHDDRVGPDGAKRGLEIPPVQIVVADVGTQPCRDLGTGCRWRRARAPSVPNSRPGTRRATHVRAPGILPRGKNPWAGRPWRPRTRHRAQAGGRRLFVFTAAPCGIGGQHAAHPLQETGVVDRGPGRAADRGDAFDRVGIECAPSETPAARPSSARRRARIRRMPSLCVTSACCKRTLSRIVTTGKRGPSQGGAALLGEDDSPLPMRFRTTMKYLRGSSAMFSPTRYWQSPWRAPKWVNTRTALDPSPSSAPRVT